MNSILHTPTFLPSCLPAEERLSRSANDARDRAVLVVAALEWTALAVAALAFIGAGAVLYLG